MNFDSLPTIEILERLDRLAGATLEILRERCYLLAALAARGEHHPQMNDLYLRHFKDVAEGRLHIKAVDAFAGARRLLENLRGAPLDVQVALAEGAKIKVAVQKDGHFVFEDKSYLQMDLATAKRAVSSEGLRSLKDQEHMLAAAYKAPEPFRKIGPDITVKLGKDRLVIGKKEVTVDQLREALEALGYRVQKMPARRAA
jgi:hypothetical protein